MAWIRDNIGRIEELFANAKAGCSCEELTALEKSLASSISVRQKSRQDPLAILRLRRVRCLTHPL